MYREAQSRSQTAGPTGQPGQGGAGGGQAKEGEVVDADFEDLGDKKS
jgi:hypothetical protein